MNEKNGLPDLLAAIRRNLLILLAPLVVLGGVASYLAWRAEDVYSASAVVRIVDGRRALTGGMEAVAAEKMLGNSTDPVYSQLQILRSRTLVGSVVASEGLQLDRGEYANLIDQLHVDSLAFADSVHLQFSESSYEMVVGAERASAPYGYAAAVAGVQLRVLRRPSAQAASLPLANLEVATDALLRNLRTRTRDKTDVIGVEYRHPHPLIAQRVANSLVEAFRAASAEAAQQDARRRRIFLEEQLAKTQGELQGIQAELGQFRQREQVFSSRDKFAAEQASMTETERVRAELTSQRAIFESLLAKLSSSDVDKTRAIMAAPGAAQNPAIATLYRQLVEYETALDTLRTGRYRAAATDPEVQRLGALIASAERNIADAVRGEIAAINARLSAASSRLAQAGSNIRTLPHAEAEEVTLTQRLESVQRVAAELSTEYHRARMAESVEAGQVEILDFATVPTRPVPAHGPLKVAVGLLAGLLLGASIAFLRERGSVSFRGMEDVSSTLDVPALGIIPKIRSKGKATTPHALELVAAREYESTTSEAYRILRMNLLFASAEKRGKGVFAVTSATPGEGKTTTAANVATVWAQTGARVLLIDADLRRPRMHTVFGIDRENGLADVLLASMEVEAAIRPSRIENLNLMPCGMHVRNPAEVVGMAAMDDLLVRLRGMYDLVVIDCPPVLVAPDAALVSRATDGVMLVCRAGKTPRQMVRNACSQLARGGASLLGVALNDPDDAARRYGGDGYYADKYGYYAEKRSA